MTHNSSTLILTKNLAFVTNADEPESIEIKFEVIKAPQFGVLQRLRSDSAGNNGEWQNAQHFTSFQLAREQIRYLHTSGGPTHDEFKVSNIYTPLAACRSTPVPRARSLFCAHHFFLNHNMISPAHTHTHPPARLNGWVEKKRSHTHKARVSAAGTEQPALCFNLRVKQEGILENIQMLHLIYASCDIISSSAQPKCGESCADFRVHWLKLNISVCNEAERVFFYDADIIEFERFKRLFCMNVEECVLMGLE